MGESLAMTLLELLYLLKKRLKLVIVLPLVCALAVGMYVLVQHDNANSNSLSSDLSASQMVTNDVATLLKSDRVVLETAKALGLEDLKGYTTSITSSTTSCVLILEVTGTDPPAHRRHRQQDGRGGLWRGPRGHERGLRQRR